MGCLADSRQLNDGLDISDGGKTSLDGQRHYQGPYLAKQRPFGATDSICHRILHREVTRLHHYSYFCLKVNKISVNHGACNSKYKIKRIYIT
jgi:hypothetical protein